MKQIPGYSKYLIDTNGNVFSTLTNKVLKPGTYAALKEATKCVGAPESTISRVCNGQRKTAAGYKWRYLNND